MKIGNADRYDVSAISCGRDHTLARPVRFSRVPPSLGGF